jgi:hypothetical protein
MSIVNKKFKNFTINIFDNDCLGVKIANGKFWEPHIFNFLKLNLNKNSVFVDIGSNYGFHSLAISKKCKEIYSFEPQVVMCELQKLSIQQSNINNIKVYNCALGDKNELSYITQIDYSHPSINMGDVGIEKKDINNCKKIKIKKLDSFDLNFVDFIKIDVQGYEKFVIEGSIKTIEKHKPTLIIEFENHQFGKFNYHSNDLFCILKEMNYEIFLLDFHYPVDFIFVHKDNLNIFFKKNSDYIKDLLVDNEENKCLQYGINKKIYFNDEISNELINIDI